MELYTSGGDGAVYIWDLRQRSCRARFVDEGSLRGTSLALSPDDSLLAAGEQRSMMGKGRGGVHVCAIGTDKYPQHG